MKTAIIMAIQRFCIHDGPGIRTTVFLKGCPMQCAWCHNPESQAMEPEMMFFENSCINCRQCETVCNRGAHYYEDGVHKIKVELCRACNQQERCQAICCTKSIARCGESMTVKEVFREVLRDRDFYGENGGVTFSGGEPLMQYEFLQEVMKCCKEASISVCLDTTLNVQWEAVSSIIPYVDVYLIDIKFMDEEQHIALTGESNKKLLENIKRLSDLGARMIIRMPIIENMNDSEREMMMRKKFLKGLTGIERIDMIPVTNHGNLKYKALGRKNTLFNHHTDLDLLIQRARKLYDAI